MGVILTIARKEWQEALRDGRVIATALLTMVLLGTAVALGALAWRTGSLTRAEAEALTRTHWESQGATNPHSAAHYGMYAFQPMPPLAALEPGVQPYAGTVTLLEAHRMNEFRHRPAQDAGDLQRFANLSAGGVLQLLVPLLIIVAAFGAFAGERDRGTLRQLLALGIAPDQLLAGKLLGVGALLAAWLALAGGLAVILLVSLSGMPLGELLGMLPLFLLPHVILYAGWLVLAVGVSAWAPSGRTALLLLLTLWGVGGLLVPRALTGPVSAAVPTPTLAEFTARIAADRAEGIDGHSPRSARAIAFRDSVLATYGVDSVSQLPVAFSGLALQQDEEETNQVLDLRYGELWAEYERQETLRDYVGVLAPNVAVRSLAMAVAGTDVASHHRFQRHAEAYRRMFVKAMNDDLAVHGVAEGFAYAADSSLWAAVPPFQYEAIPGGQAMRQRPVALASLGGWMVLAMALALMGTHRLGRIN